MLWLRHLARSHEKQKLSYLYYQIACGRQVWQEGNLPWWAPTQMSHDPLIKWSCEITQKIKTIISWLSQCLWPPIGRIVTYLKWLLTIRSFNALLTVSCKVTRDKRIQLYLYYRSPKIPKLGRMIIYLEGL